MAATMPDPSTRLTFPAADRMVDLLAPYTKRNTNSRTYASATPRRNAMTEQRFRVGIVGLEPGRGWAARAHVPALRALSDSYEIVGVANTSLASAQRAAAALGLPRAFNDVAELVSAPEVDIVTVTVKVPHHLEVVKAAIEAGKHVYCEWPLGNGLAEAEELAELAKAKSILGVVGTQARVSPEIEYLKQLIMDGFVGEGSIDDHRRARRRLGRLHSPEEE
jgi:predicted dehydrogenase